MKIQKEVRYTIVNVVEDDSGYGIVIKDIEEDKVFVKAVDRITYLNIKELLCL